MSEQLSLIMYKLEEMKEDLKPIKDLDRRVGKLEKFTSMVHGIMWSLLFGFPAIYFIIHHIS